MAKKDKLVIKNCMVCVKLPCGYTYPWTEDKFDIFVRAEKKHKKECRKCKKISRQVHNNKIGLL